MNTSIDFSAMTMTELKTMRQNLEWEISERKAERAKMSLAYVHDVLSGLKTVYGCNFCVIDNSIVVTNDETGEVMVELDVTTI